MFSHFPDVSPSPSLPTLQSPAKRSTPSRQIDTGRKTYKLLKKREPVWPPVLESALIQGLAQYVPQSSKDPRSLQRFPARNKYISEFIKRKTGKFRTAKQVGSRLQQLRETCTDAYIIHLIGSKDFKGRESVGDISPTDSSFSTSSYNLNWASSDSQVSSPVSDAGQLTSPPTHYNHEVAVTLALFEFDSSPNSADAHPTLTLDLDEQPLGTSPSFQNPSATFMHYVDVRTTRSIAQCSPVMIFTSNRFSSEAEYRCDSEVCIDGKAVYCASALLEPCTTGLHSSYPYKLEMRQDVWAILTRDPKNYASYTLTQHIYTVSTGTIHDESPVFSITYSLECGYNPPSNNVSPFVPHLYDPASWSSQPIHTNVQADYNYSLKYTSETELAYPPSDGQLDLCPDLGYSLPEIGPQISLFYPTHPIDLVSLNQEPGCSYQSYF